MSRPHQSAFGSRRTSLFFSAPENEPEVPKVSKDPPKKELFVTFPESTLEENMVTWDGPNDPTNPQNWSVKYKWLVSGVSILATIDIAFASSSPTSATLNIIKEFDISLEVSDLVTTLYLLGYVFGPLFWGPGSELFGRRPTLVLPMILFTVAQVGQALAPNIQTLLVARFLSGFFGSAPLTNCGGVISDTWSTLGRGPVTGLFVTSVFLGPVMGPVVSGFIVDSSVSWKWVFWVLVIFAGVSTTILTIVLPETYAPVILLKKKKKMCKEDPVGSTNLYAEHERQDWSVMGVIRRTLFRPFHMLAREPILLLITIYVSIIYGLLYALFQAFPIIFVVKRRFTIAQDGLVFLGIGIGTCVGAIINYYYTSVHYHPELIKKWKGYIPPEHRLYGAMVGSPILVIGTFWLGWTGQYAKIPWYVPALSTVFIGTGINLIFMSFLSYVVDAYMSSSASALAANTVVRSAVAASFPLFTVQLFTNLGVNWACTLIGCIALLFLPCPFLFFKYGSRIRAHSKFAPCIDLQIAAALNLKDEKEDYKH